MSARRLPVLALATLVAALAGASSASAAPVPEGATWHEDYISEPDGTKLHVDVLRPKGLPDNAKTPVILSIGPYFNHSGQTGPVGPVEETPFDPAASPGPSTRFYDFETGGDLFKKGYTYVMVDLRDFGGSTGCADWGVPREQ